jgi:hypothetical protein
MQGDFESVHQSSSKDCIIWVVHVDDIKGYVLCSWVLRGA